jgi:hypothetical protein
MTPNLFVATQTLFSPHKWFKPSQKGARPKRKTEHWDSPVAGIYEYIPGRGWYLVATDKTPTDQSSTNVQTPEKKPAPEHTDDTATRETVKMHQPVQVKYSKVLKRYLLAPDYDMRKRHGKVQGSHGKSYEAGFFRLDDGTAWVECWDEEGVFIPGPYKLWCLDQTTGNFRHMLKGDDPSYVRSRANSIESRPGSRRSQDSRSTQFRSGPGSTRDGPSCPSTRANSIKQLPPTAPTSKPGSHTGSRRGSPKRSPSIPLEEAKERLKAMAAEQAARSRASSFADDGSLRRPSPLPSPKIGT